MRISNRIFTSCQPTIQRERERGVGGETETSDGLLYFVQNGKKRGGKTRK